MRVLFVLLVLCLPFAAVAQTDPADRARAALALLDEASDQLDRAQSARDRVRALTQTISAFEEGLTALRSGVRQAALREVELSAKVQDSDDEIAALLVALQRMGGAGSPVALLHPGGPTGTARAGMLLADVTPALNVQAAALRRDLEELEQARALQTDAAIRLENALAEIQQARTALNQAMADRTELPKRFINDPVREAILIASADTLERFAAGLDRIAVDQIADAPRDLAGQKGALPLPVQGRLLRQFEEADAAGITRSGIILASLPQAIVTSPVAATIRYIGPLLDFGQVVILEPQADVLFVFAGVETAYGTAGDVIEPGTPLGLMGGTSDKSAADFSTDSDQTGADPTETLYIEVRQDNTPEDPSLWFRMDKDG
ncbi:MAG: murein hydrolase activator EnvC [Roseobacter sp.]